MNNLLQLKGTFEQSPRNNGFGSPNLPTGKIVQVNDLERLLNNLINVRDYWNKNTLLSGALVSVHYIKLAAKSNRITGLLINGTKKPSDYVVGAKFSSENNPKHIITHYVPREFLNESIDRLRFAIDILNEYFKGIINHELINKLNEKKINFPYEKKIKSKFLSIIVDSYYVEKFDIPNDDISEINQSIVTIYKTDESTKKILSKIDIDILPERIIDETTVLLRPDQLSLLKEKAPYLIAMTVIDLSEITSDNFEFCDNKQREIPSPKNEPTIGVIDTLFDENIYFSEWVEYTKKLESEMPEETSDFIHGTAVTSIIVDGPSLNKNLDDGCGRFKVRHFGVASGKSFNSFNVMRNIIEIISQNKDIKVWNLSLGSNANIHPNFISPEAAILDKIQFENDVIFVIAGTNLAFNETKTRPIGSPADSINSIVVNSVNMKKVPATYSRRGRVLSFFMKPDVSYYGGDIDEKICVYTPTGEKLVQGTSYAAPWIARKLSYLIDVLGLSRETAKALLVNATAGWSKQESDLTLTGYGVVPINIQDIVQCADDEIQFVIQGVSENYDTYNYNIPVPVVKEKHPFIAKATLCYFPNCSRNQGVDYTNTELNISFGRLNDQSSIQKIKSSYLNKEDITFLTEEDDRNYFRKWDNVKHIREVNTGSLKERKAYKTGLWGLSLKTNERLLDNSGKGLNFGVVITLKEINGVNRINDFIKKCSARGWLVNKIDVENRIDIYNSAEQEIEFDE